MIQTGKKKTNVRAVIYGPEGIGKSTLASKFPKPLFIDIEGGTFHLDVARIEAPKSWSAIVAILADIASGRLAAEYQTLVIDTADWAERSLKDAICQEARVQAIGDVPYGQLYQKLGAKWGAFLDELGRIGNKKHVILLAHSQLTHCEIPEETGSFDRYELKLNNSFKVSTAAMTKEWASIVLFLNYEIILVSIDGKSKAQGGQRVCYTTHAACWDAKNRYGLPEKIKMPTDESMPPELARVVAEAGASEPAPAPAAPAPAPAAPAPPPATAPAPAAPTAPVPHAAPPPGAPAPSCEKQHMLAQLGEIMTLSGIAMQELDAELAAKGVVPTGTNPRDYNEATLSRVINGWHAISTNIQNRRKGAIA